LATSVAGGYSILGNYHKKQKDKKLYIAWS